jgi:hypothetical protein
VQTGFADTKREGHSGLETSFPSSSQAKDNDDNVDGDVMNTAASAATKASAVAVEEDVEQASANDASDIYAQLGWNDDFDI